MEGNAKWVAVTAVAPVAWGSTYYVTRELLPPDAPLFGAAVRALPAGLLLLLLCRRLPRGRWWWRSLVLGVLNTSAFFALVYLAAQLLPTSVAAVVMSASSVVIMLMAWLVVAERPRVVAVVGAGAGVVGVAAMVLDGGESVSGMGVLASVGAMLMSSLGYALAKRWGGEVPVLASTSWQLVAGGLVVSPVALVLEGVPGDLDAGAVAGFAYISVVATAVAFAAWFAGLQHLEAGRVGLIGLLNPVTGVVLGLGLAGERLTSLQVAGLVLTLAGMALGQLSRRPRPPTGAGEPIPTTSRTSVG